MRNMDYYDENTPDRIKAVRKKAGGYRLKTPVCIPKPVYKGDRLSAHGFDTSGLSMFGFSVPGVYAVCCRKPPGAEHLLYIGSSTNVTNRIMTPGHWPDRLTKRMGYGVVYFRVLHISDGTHHEVEKRLIRQLRPLLNIVYAK